MNRQVDKHGQSHGDRPCLIHLQHHGQEEKTTRTRFRMHTCMPLCQGTKGLTISLSSVSAGARGIRQLLGFCASISRQGAADSTDLLVRPHSRSTAVATKAQAWLVSLSKMLGVVTLHPLVQLLQRLYSIVPGVGLHSHWHTGKELVRHQFAQICQPLPARNSSLMHASRCFF